jgi:HlyD family secretion protein
VTVADRARSRRLLLALAAVLVVVALAAWALWPRPLEVQIATVMRGPLRAWVEEQAITRVPQVYQITMPIEGRVLPIELVEGQRVQRGQVVAMLELDDLQSEFAAAEARLAQVEAQLAQATDARLELTALEQVNEFLVSLDRTVDAAEERTRAGRARRDFAADQRRRAEQAHAAGAMTQTELERIQLEAVQAEVEHQADVLTLRATIATRAAARIAPRFINEYIELRSYRQRMLEADLRQAREELERRRRDLERARITSPADGVVFARRVWDLATLPAGAPLMEIGRLEDLEIEVELLSEEAVRIAPGAPAEVYGGAAGDNVLHAQVARIHPQAFTKISALGIEQQRVLVILRFEAGELARLGEQARLGADFRIRVRILVDERPDTLRLPRTAIFRGPHGTWQTFAVRAGRAELADLTVGLITPQHVEVLAGVRESEPVILSPPTGVEAGRRVRAAGR